MIAAHRRVRFGAAEPGRRTALGQHGGDCYYRAEQVCTYAGLASSAREPVNADAAQLRFKRILRIMLIATGVLAALRSPTWWMTRRHQAIKQRRRHDGCAHCCCSG
jgi:hypothetical protein